jgi:hypothetical protein
MTQTKGEARLMELGRQVLYAETLFGKDSLQYHGAVERWKAQQRKLGIR